jgi:hypothetical protein
MSGIPLISFIIVIHFPLIKPESNRLCAVAIMASSAERGRHPDIFLPFRYYKLYFDQETSPAFSNPY